MLYMTHALSLPLAEIVLLSSCQIRFLSEKNLIRIGQHINERIF